MYKPCDACGLPISPGETATVIGDVEWQDGDIVLPATRVKMLVLCRQCGEHLRLEAPYLADVHGFRIYVDRRAQAEWIGASHQPVDFTDMLAKVLEHVRRGPAFRYAVVAAHLDPKQLRIVLDRGKYGKEVLVYSKVSRTLIVDRIGKR